MKTAVMPPKPSPPSPQTRAEGWGLLPLPAWIQWSLPRPCAMLGPPPLRLHLCPLRSVSTSPAPASPSLSPASAPPGPHPPSTPAPPASALCVAPLPPQCRRPRQRHLLLHAASELLPLFYAATPCVCARACVAPIPPPSPRTRGEGFVLCGF
jgi:hypothetical protein